MSEQNAATRNALARLDTAIIDLEAEQQESLRIQEEARVHALAILEIKGRLMAVRTDLRPLLDSTAPREFPYDKR